MKFETRAVHAGGHFDREGGGVAPAIHLSTTFVRDEQLELSAEYGYIREGNVNQSRLEEALASIEGGAASLVFASGMAAGTALIQALGTGAHLVLPDDCYYGFRVLANDFLKVWGVTTSFVDMANLDAVRDHVRHDRTLLWCESPSNPLLKVVDLSALASLARSVGALSVVDGTFATPALQQPLSLGADIVLHSTTKYLGGHSDVQGGALVFRERGDLHDRVEHVRHITGGVASPFNSWLVLRGIRTLAARMRIHCENAVRVAVFLEQHPRVEKVFYPGSSSHPLHDVARRQMSDFGGMLSFLVKGTREDAMRVVSRCRLFVRATSLGGTESLIEHRASSEGAASTAPDRLIRVSVGLEHPDDLVADLEQALS
jgi:cystathionine gamma-synthase